MKMRCPRGVDDCICGLIRNKGFKAYCLQIMKALSSQIDRRLHTTHPTNIGNFLNKESAKTFIYYFFETPNNRIYIGMKKCIISRKIKP